MEVLVDEVFDRDEARRGGPRESWDCEGLAGAAWPVRKDVGDALAELEVVESIGDVFNMVFGASSISERQMSVMVL